MMEAVNSESEDDTTPIVSSRYSIVMATSKRARQLVNGRPTTVRNADSKKPLSVAIEELEKGDIKILAAE